MVFKDDLYVGMTLYFFDKYGKLMMCDVFEHPRSPSGYGYVIVGDNTLYFLTDNELERMFRSKKEAEQIELFQWNGEDDIYDTYR